MTRWNAAASHLTVSALVVSLLAVFLALTWFPPDLVGASGGVGLIGILAGVDVSLGPLLTLIVWDVKKPMHSLRLDVAIIVFIQLAALGYGLHTAFLARPVYIVFAIDRFEVVSAAEIPPEEFAKVSREAFKTLPLFGPQVVAVQKPTDAKEWNRILFSAVAGGADLSQMPQHYVPYQEAAAAAAKRAQPLARLMVRGAASRDKLTAFLAKHALDPVQVGYLPLQARVRDQSILLDTRTGDVLGIVDIDPWQ